MNSVSIVNSHSFHISMKLVLRQKSIYIYMVNCNWFLLMTDIGNLNGRISVIMDVNYTCNYRYGLILVNFVESIKRVQ